jgi:hypothetical protein
MAVLPPPCQDVGGRFCRRPVYCHALLVISLLQEHFRLSTEGTDFWENLVPGILPHPKQPGRLAAKLLAVDPDTKPRHFGDVMLTGKLLSNSPNVYFQIEMEN